jgi:glycine betaine/proline transport system substrate-binding protein
MAWAEGEKVWPCAYDITRKFTMDSDEVGKLVYEVDVQGRTVEDAAMEWAKNNEPKWREWSACATK